ncbi:hypothetical protein GCM10010269_45610 [Streptomyces humidus]|uniref:Uncharacterized protein n=1 Tax=Streptomyces humidus TaxID=52259 RepID=A0A918L542_9ACTN|nr:hypothetical protein [Streptomyces humidus]GGS01587.1 hypothetical protein GCM10010269_45610 [Streptomyces humidus]
MAWLSLANVDLPMQHLLSFSEGGSPARYAQHMNPEGIANAVVSVLAAAGTLAGVTSRTRRRRNEIRENLSLAEELQKNTILRDHTPAVAWLHGKIALDVAKLSGQPIGAPKKPIPKGSVVFATILLLAFGSWTYWLNRDGFVWYSLVTGALAASMAISILGMTTNREIPPDAENEMPEGAHPLGSQSPAESIVTSVAMAAMSSDGRFEDEGQLGVAFRFIRHMTAGEFDDAVNLADENWLRCRIQAWLWNARAFTGDDEAQMQATTDAMMITRSGHAFWEAFSSAEVEFFQDAWGEIDPDQLGGASRRRRVARDYDLVIVAPLGESGGYFVNSPTPVPGGLTFLMHNSDGSWLLANHLGGAPPLPGYPPSWWIANDPSLDELRD